MATSSSTNEPSKPSESEDKGNQIMESQLREEEFFSMLFNEVLDGLLHESEKITEEEVSNAVERIISSFRYKQLNRPHFSEINLNEPNTLCGYLFRYGSHGAGLSRFRVFEALQNCEELACSLKKSSVIKIVSCGGGPGNDAIGFCSALFDFHFSGRLEITIIDALNWFACVQLAKTLLSTKNFGNVTQMFNENRVSLSYIQTTLPGNPTDCPNCFRVLGQADIILITRLISILDWDTKKKLYQALYDTMKASSFILVIDCPFWEEDVRDWFNVLYISDAQTVYESTVIKRRFGHYTCNQSKARIAVLTKKTKL